MPATPAPTLSRRRQLLDDVAAVARDLGVVCLGMTALGVGFGVLAVSYGFPWWLAPIISLTVYAGSLEFLLVGLLAVGAPLLSIAITSLLVNSRHLFYGLTFPLHRIGSPAARAYSVFALTDEAYAVLTPQRTEGMRSSRIIMTQVFFHVAWVGGTVIGSLLGQAFITDVEGLDFMLTALFLVLTIEAFRANPDMSVLGIAIAAALIGFLISPESMLPLAMLIFVVLLPVLRTVRLKREARRA